MALSDKPLIPFVDVPSNIDTVYPGSRITPDRTSLSQQLLQVKPENSLRLTGLMNFAAVVKELPTRVQTFTDIEPIVGMYCLFCPRWVAEEVLMPVDELPKSGVATWPENVAKAIINTGISLIFSDHPYQMTGFIGNIAVFSCYSADAKTQVEALSYDGVQTKTFSCYLVGQQNGKAKAGVELRMPGAPAMETANL